MAIDMKSYAGEVTPPAAVEQQELNQFQRESLDEEFQMPEMPREAPVEIETQQVNPTEPTAQELNFRALSESVEKLKAEKEADKREYQLQLEMLRANLNKKSEPDAQERKMFQGMDDSDIPTVGELRKAWEQRETTYNQKIEELQVANQHSDYAEVLNKYGKHLAETDPLFLQGINGAENKALFAYQYAKREQELQTLRDAMKSQATVQQPQQSAIAQKIVENARKPGTLAQVGGQSTLSKADYYASMSDGDFMKMANKYLEEI